MKRYSLTQFFLTVIIITVFLVGNGSALAQDPFPTEIVSTEKELETDPNHYLPANQVLPSGIGTEDFFGYTIDDTIPYSWIEIESTGYEADLQGDDAWVEGIVLTTFPFKYYEQEFTEFSIATNGYISFGSGHSAYRNTELPFPGEPQNIIAGFWDDLDVVYNPPDYTGKVFYQNFATYTVIEWKNVNRHGTPAQKLTFEIILHSNGNIDVLYNTLPGTVDSATVGIEDQDGVDGVTYLANAPGLVAGEAVRFVRPPANWRVKALPLYQGKFAIRPLGSQKGIANFSFDVKNIGAMGSDTFELIMTPSSLDWEIEVASSAGPVEDTNASGTVDTGPIPQGSFRTFYVTFRSQDDALPGNDLKLNIDIQSFYNPSAHREIVIQTSIPTNFAQVLFDSNHGLDIHLIWPYGYRVTRAEGIFTGSTLSVASLLDGRYFYLWERNETRWDGSVLVPYTNVQFAFLRGDGLLNSGVQNLTDNYERVWAERSITDRSPVAAVSPVSGLTSVIWIRDIISSTVVPTGTIFMTNSNVYMSIFNANNMGSPIVSEMNVTNNSEWKGTGDLHVPNYSSPGIAATADDRFALVWVNSHDEGSGEVSDIEWAVFSTSGIAVVQPQSITASVEDKYMDPTITNWTSTAVPGNFVVIAYSQFNRDLGSYTLFYTSYETDGSPGKSPTQITGSQGWLPDILQIDQDTTILAWTQTTAPSRQAAYLVLNSLLNVVGSPVMLETPNDRQSDYISLGTDSNGNCLITWLETDLTQNLYYVLLGPNGTILTEPMAFHTVSGDNALSMPHSGFGLAGYTGYFYTELPLIRKALTGAK